MLWVFFSQWSNPVTAGVTESNKKGFDIHPNPSNGNFPITSTINTSYVVVSVNGKNVAQGKLIIVSNRLDLSHLEKGVYFLKNEKQNG